MRTCICENVKIGAKYSADQCKPCWMFRHVRKVNLREGGDGRVAAIQFDRVAESKRPYVPPAGPGTEFEKLADSLGFDPVLGCACKRLSRKMNRWGVEGCRENREYILCQLHKHAQKYGWWDRIKAGALATVNGLVLRIDPLDPLPGLLDEAIRRAAATPVPEGQGV